MAEYIEREAAYCFAQDQLKKETGAYSKGWNNALGVMKSALHNNDAIPAADVVPVKHGRWKPHSKVETPVFHCSVCGGAALHAFGKQCKSDYCPNCGALMDKDGGGDV